MKFKFTAYAFFTFLIMIIGVKESARAQNNAKVDKTIDCLNDKIISYGIGINQLKNVTRIHPELNGLSTRDGILVHSFEGQSNYNKLDFKFEIDYYFSDDLSMSSEMEKILLVEHDVELKKNGKEFIARFDHYIIRISLNKEFDESFVYLKDIAYRLSIDYINNCGK